MNQEMRKPLLKESYESTISGLLKLGNTNIQKQLLRDYETGIPW